MSNGSESRRLKSRRLYWANPEKANLKAKKYREQRNIKARENYHERMAQIKRWLDGDFNNAE